MRAGWKRGTLVQAKGAKQQDSVGEIVSYEGECFYTVRWDARVLICHEDDLQAFAA